MKSLVFILLFAAVATQGFAQVKYEKESRVKKSDVPAYAKEYVDLYQFDKRVKWYKEIGFNSISFEAKTKFQGKNYSIEFSDDGSFEDIEIEIKSNEIPPEIFSTISNYLVEKHTKYSIEKIQIQYLGDKQKVLNYLQNNGKSNDVVMNYEIVISTKLQGTFTMLEYLFSDEGGFMQKEQIVLKRTDNIEF
jgi:hypothetical protein